MKYVGVDVGKRKYRAAIVDEDGVLIKGLSFVNDFLGLKDLSGRFLKVMRLL
jgi:predicted NBD/HSP70 family sugar kinase